MKNKKINIPTYSKDEILVVKVGTDERPASEDDIKEIQLLLAQAAANKSLCIVTHHAIDFVKIKRNCLQKVISHNDIKTK